MCQAILADAEDFLKQNPIETLSAIEVLKIFIDFCEGKSIDPQFWLSFKDNKFSGYMITNAIAHNHAPSVYIRGAYIHPQQRGNGVAPFCLETLEKQSKKHGAKYIILQTDRIDPRSYSRLIGRFGYKYMCTQFRKEI